MISDRGEPGHWDCGAASAGGTGGAHFGGGGNPLKTQPLRLDDEVKEIQEALRRSRQRDNFQVNMRLAATPKDLRRALLDLEPQILHFSGHGAGAEGLVFVSDASTGAIYRSADGTVQS